MNKFIAALLLSFPLVALGHHSRAEFANASIEVEGVLTEIIWKNPHVALFLDVAKENGEFESWRLEGPTNLVGLQRSGVESDLFEVGDRVRVVGNPSTLRQTLQANNIQLSDGTEVIMSPSVRAYWDGPYVGGNSVPAEEVVLDRENLGFFRVWHPVGNPMMKLNQFAYTQDALDSRRQWDLVDNPIVRCEQPGMPVPLFHPQPLLFAEESENFIGMRHGYFDTQRRVHMDPSINAQEQSSSHLGFSQGRWEDETTLVIETTGINYPYFDFSGTSQSEDIRVIERYSLSDDMTQLNFEVTIDDPLALAQTASTNWHFIAQDKPYSAYECDVF